MINAQQRFAFVFSVEDARRNITKADMRAMDVEMKAGDVKELSDNVGQKLEDLKNKILKARQAASNVSMRRGALSNGDWNFYYLKSGR